MFSLFENADLKNSKFGVLFKKSIYHLIFIFVIIILSFALYYYDVKHKTIYKKQVQDLNNQKNSVSYKLEELKVKINVAEKFNKVWNTELDEQFKKSIVVDEKYIGNIVSNLEKNNLLTNVNFRILSTKKYKESKYDGNVKIFVSEVSFSFNCLSEHSVYNFIDGFKNLFDGFAILKSVRIINSKDFDKSFLKNMVNGKLDYLISANVTMYLYYIKL